MNCATGKPASANSAIQFAAEAGVDAAGAPCDVSLCTGTASRLTSRPVLSSVSDTIPERVGGGFSGVTMLAPPIGINRRGLCRCQKSNAGG